MTAKRKRPTRTQLTKRRRNERQHARRRWHGPLSVVGVLASLSWIDLQLLGLVRLPGPYWLIWAAPLAGLPLLFFRGRPRQLGLGLLVSLVGYPLALVGLVLLV